MDNAPICVITGAGCCTASGIFDYRNEEGEWKRKPPVQLNEFLRSPVAQRAYWARSMLGWPAFHQAKPNIVHRVIKNLADLGLVSWTITQNVDDLHQQAQQPNLITLHGCLTTASCIECGHSVNRQSIQLDLECNNPEFVRLSSPSDAGGEGHYSKPIDDSFWIPSCPQCHGLLKPDVVFFGGSLNPTVKQQADQAIADCKGVLVAGSSLMVYSSFRLVRRAFEKKVPIASVNRGRTRAEGMYRVKIEDDISQVFTQLSDRFEIKTI